MYCRCAVHNALNREPGENPGRSRRCTDEGTFTMPLSQDGKANVSDDSKSEDLPVIDAMGTTSDGPHYVCINCKYQPFLVGKAF